MDRRSFVVNGSALLAIGVMPVSLLTDRVEGPATQPYREVALDATVEPGEARRLFERELDSARKRHPVYVLYYQAESPHLATYRRAVDTVLRRRKYRGAVISVDIDRHADLARHNFFDVDGRPYTINASFAAFVDGELMSFYRTSIRSEVDGTPFSLSYPGIAGVTAGPLGDDVEKLTSRIAGFVERTDQAFAQPAK